MSNPREPRTGVPDEYTINAEGQRVCGARKKQGGRCRTTKVMENGRCRLHGGKTPRGLASPNLKTGRYSLSLPAQLLSRLEVALSDEELLSLREDIGLVQALILQRLDEIKDAQAQPDLTAIIERTTNITDNWRTWDFTRMQRELRELVDVMTKRQTERDALREVRDLLDQKARMIAQENRRQVELQQNISVQEALLLAQALVGIVRQAVMPLEGGGDALRVISSQFNEVISLRALPGARSRANEDV